MFDKYLSNIGISILYWFAILLSCWGVVLILSSGFNLILPVPFFRSVFSLESPFSVFCGKSSFSKLSKEVSLKLPGRSRVCNRFGFKESTD